MKITDSINNVKSLTLYHGSEKIVSNPKYELNTEHLNIVNLASDSFSVLHWLAILNVNRKPTISTALSAESARFLHDNYLPDLSDADVIIGNRADDSYFSFVRYFLNNEISLEQLEKSMKLGELGLQVMIKA